jgi:hypothetical protein
MKFIYGVILVIGSLISHINSSPIYSPHNKQINLDPAIVVTKPNKIILFNKDENSTKSLDIDITPPPPNPINDIMPANFILPDGTILYTPKDSKPFINS